MKRLMTILAFTAGCGASQAGQPSSVTPTAGEPSATAAPPPAAGGTAGGAAPVVHLANVEASPAIKAVLDAPDRADKDRALDAGRRPAELLTFAGIAPGMHVAELGAGSGYTSELLSRTVGPSGVVYAQNNKWILERFADKPLAERLAKPALKNVLRADREFDDPLPPEAKNLDAVFSVLFYHDTVWLGVDRDKMNRAVFAALKPGGEYVIVDHSAKEGSGIGDVKTLHRIDERAVVEEVERAGFHLTAIGDFLRNSADTRDWNDSPMAAADRRGKSDRFVLRFARPSS